MTLKKKLIVILALLIMCIIFWVSFNLYKDVKNILWWERIKNPSQEFLKSKVAEEVANELLSYQIATGAWAKNLHENTSDKLNIKQSTIDNDATTAQINYLAKLYLNSPKEIYKQSIVKGIKYLIIAQYPNGGYPQFFPWVKDYRKYITYNDDAMVNVLSLLNKVRQRQQPFGNILDEYLINYADRAYKKGIDCILKTQVVINGKKTIWAQQYDENTLLPVKARTFEPIALSTRESVKIVELLMAEYEQNRNPEVLESINSALEWFKNHKIIDTKVLRFDFLKLNKSFQFYTIKVKSAPSIWARFYSLDNQQPIFSDRSGNIYSNFKDVDFERKIGYEWYIFSPNDLIINHEKWIENL